MHDKTCNVLFLCTHNSARSILAEALLNSLGGGRYRAWSAGSQPSGTVNPYALKTLAALGIPTEPCRSKDWCEFAAPGAPEFEFIITVCDNAAGEVCPLWPGQPMTAHWGVADPSAVQGSESQKAQAFRDTAVILERRIKLMLALPLPTLDRMALRREIRSIGAR
jgi:arsenate reductase